MLLIVIMVVAATALTLFLNPDFLQGMRNSKFLDELYDDKNKKTKTKSKDLIDPYN